MSGRPLRRARGERRARNNSGLVAKYMGIRADWYKDPELVRQFNEEMAGGGGGATAPTSTAVAHAPVKASRAADLPRAPAPALARAATAPVRTALGGRNVYFVRQPYFGEDDAPSGYFVSADTPKEAVQTVTAARRGAAKSDALDALDEAEDVALVGSPKDNIFSVSLQWYEDDGSFFDSEYFITVTTGDLHSVQVRHAGSGARVQVEQPGKLTSRGGGISWIGPRAPGWPLTDYDSWKERCK